MSDGPFPFLFNFVFHRTEPKKRVERLVNIIGVKRMLMYVVYIINVPYDDTIGYYIVITING